ncbi:hypothetical protein IEO21_02897 [Rhodonia placenta]|uniref:Uncharacterized protein n=1 Tax=Rhodonia placenta TaxID=104341 RepID=A0A8H7U3Y9_9APHY|nr:hypothetical protein IEO21_02897 [Postia placenta]
MSQPTSQSASANQSGCTSGNAGFGLVWFALPPAPLRPTPSNAAPHRRRQNGSSLRALHMWFFCTVFNGCRQGLNCYCIKSRRGLCKLGGATNYCRTRKATVNMTRDGTGPWCCGGHMWHSI